MKTSTEFAGPLALLRAEVAASDLLPGEYACFRPLVADGLCFFLERLRPARLRGIFREQAAMGDGADLAERVAALVRHVPTLHKLGQVLARERRLDAGFRARLHQLESVEARTPREELERALDRELPGWRRRGIELGPKALAEGSVAVIAPLVWPAGDGDVRCGVAKLLKSGIERYLDEELAIWPRLGEHLEEACVRYHLPALDYRETFEVVRDLLMHEVRLDLEQQHMDEARDELADCPGVHIPALLPFCTPRLTAMERLDGRTLGAELLQEGAGDGRWARRVVEALLAGPMFSARESALFHGDPHAGNLFVMGDGRLAILDWSLAGRLPKRERIELGQLLLGALTLDSARMAAATDRLLVTARDRSAVMEAVQGSVREIRWGTPPGLTWLTRFLDDVAVRARGRFRPELLLFRKTLLTLEGVLADAAGPVQRGGGGVDGMLAAVLGWRLAAEWPERLLAPWDSRRFGTHWSTLDLWQVLGSGPATAARFWGGFWADWMAPGRPRSLLS